MKKYILALDAGTTSNRAILFDKDARVAAASQQEFPQYYPKPRWVEQDARDILAGMEAVAKEAISRAEASPEEIAAIGIANQRETTILWDKSTGEPIANAIVWQCRRTAGMINEMKRQPGFNELLQKKTGMIPDPYFSASKIRWLLDNVPNARERANAGDILFGTVETFLAWKLSGGRLHISDVSNAARTSLFNINTLEWDSELCGIFDVPMEILPRIVSNSEIYGYTDPEIFGIGIPIGAMIGDQQSALFGQQCVHEGDAKVTYGTGAFLLYNTGEAPKLSRNGLLSTVAWQTGSDARPMYAMEGSVFTAGSAIQWLRDDLCMIKEAAETEEIARSVEDTRGCYVVPAFTGMGAPYWDAGVRGSITGLSRAVGRSHIIRATLESLCYQVNDVLRIMKRDAAAGADGNAALKADGGAANNDFILQFQADITDQRVIRPTNVESTALGCAFMAGLACGFWKRDELAGLNPCARVFVPDMDEEKRIGLLSGWKAAVQKTLFNPGS